MVIRGQARGDSGQQHAQHHRGQVSLDAEPGDGDHCTDQGRDLRPVDTKADTAHHRERHPGLLPHVPGKVHEQVHQQCTDGQRQHDLPAAQAQGIEAHGEGVVGDVVNVIGPQGEKAVIPPAPTFGLGRRQVLVMQAWAQREGGACGCIARRRGRHLQGNR
ncbi:hypothetical protein D3C85_1195290 [compost metagenome]